MFTVIIAEKEHIEKTEEYGLFLKPFLASGDVVFCQWNPRARTLEDMLPALSDVVGRRKVWRAVIVSDEAGILKQNPFDMVSHLPERFTGPIRGSKETVAEEEDFVYSEEYQAYLEAEHQKKLLAYEEAAENPLTRLTTFFCNTPTVTKAEESALAENDPGYLRYIAEHRRKQELRRQIIGDEVMETVQPTEVLCIAKRTYVSAEREFDTVWSSHTELEYSRFYDRNMYFDKMRYLVFDILPKTQRDYMFDYIRFLYVTILLASNDIPSGCLAAERVYKLDCENDETALGKLLKTYEAKLNLTKENLEAKVKQIQEKKPRVFTDREARQIFCAKVDQPVIFGADVDREELFVKTHQIGLSDGCPTDEERMWEREFGRSQKELAGMLKQSRRALKRVAANARSRQDEIYDSVELLNEFQLEDIQDFVDNQELEMLRTDVVDLYDEEAFFGEAKQMDKQIRGKIQKRMYKNTTLALGGAACAMFLLSFFTLFFKNMTQSVIRFAASLVFTALGIGAFALVAVATLFLLRGELVFSFKLFNDVLRKLSNQIYSAMDRYAKYLGHVSNIRRGNAVLNAVSRKDNPDQDMIILYKKHIADIEKAKAEAKDVFGPYMVGSVPVQSDQLFAYDFDFETPMDYQYPLPYTEGTACKITFIQTGVSAYVPVEFIKKIMVRREELYE